MTGNLFQNMFNLNNVNLVCRAQRHSYKICEEKAAIGFHCCLKNGNFSQNMSHFHYIHINKLFIHFTQSVNTNSYLFCYRFVTSIATSKLYCTVMLFLFLCLIPLRHSTDYFNYCAWKKNHLGIIATNR